MHTGILSSFKVFTAPNFTEPHFDCTQIILIDIFQKNPHQYMTLLLLRLFAFSEKNTTKIRS